MKKTVLLITIISVLAGCSTTPRQNPVLSAASNAAFTESIMRSFNARPAGKSLYIKFEPNDKPVPQKRSPGICSLLGRLKSQPQHFVINNHEPNEIQGEYGTEIAIAPDCFTSVDGQQANGQVDIELKECYTPEEMLLENLTTTSNDKKALESKSCVFVSATCGGKQLQLKQGQQIDIRFPFAVNYADGYAFYYGNEGNDGVNWTLAKGENEDGNKVKVNNPEFVYKDAGLKDYLIAQLQYPDEAKRNELSANVGVTFTVDKNGRVQDVSCASAYKTFRDEITAALQRMPKWKPATYGKKKIAAQVKLSVDFNLRRKEQVVVSFTNDNITPRTGRKDEEPAIEITFSKAFDNLGWISYSKTVDFTGQQFADVVIADDANTDVKLVVMDRNNIAGAGNYLGYSRFNSLPVGAKVYIVAMRNTDGKTFYCIQPLTLQKQTVVSLNWKSGSDETIKEALKTFNWTS